MNSEILKKLIFPASILIPCILKLYLTHGLAFSAACSRHDDLLFMRLAQSISAGAWLGEFNELTLMKGAAYPAWIALTHKLQIPLFLSQQLLYILAVLTLIFYAQPIIKSRAALIVLLYALLFNPMSFAPTAMRNGIYPALTLFTVAFAIGVLGAVNSGRMKLISSSILLGIFLSIFWFTREEGVWILPFLIPVFTRAITEIIARHRHDPAAMAGRASVLFIPALVLGAGFSGISAANKAHYNTCTILEINDPALKNAYGSLLRVRHENFRFTVPVPGEVMEKLYGASPAFKELKPFFDSPEGQKWQMGKMIYEIKKMHESGTLNPGFQNYISSFLRHDKSGVWRDIWENLNQDDRDINGGFIWAFKDAVKSCGYYDSYEKARAYYIRLSSEIDSACEDGRLDCIKKPAGMIPPLRGEYILPFLKTFLYSYYYLYSFSDHELQEPGISYGDEAMLTLYEEMTGEDLSNDLSRFDNASYRARVHILNTIGRAYQLIFPILGFSAIILHLLRLFTHPVKTVSDERLFLATAFLASISALLLILSLVHITSFPGIVTRYLAPLYPLIIVYTAYFGDTLLNSNGAYQP